jgi:hypothetical protein
MNQAISRSTYTQSLTFTGKPSEETRKKLIEAGFQYDSRSRQWYKSQEESHVVGESDVLPVAA